METRTAKTHENPCHHNCFLMEQFTGALSDISGAYVNLSAAAFQGSESIICFMTYLLH